MRLPNSHGDVIQRLGHLQPLWFPGHTAKQTSEAKSVCPRRAILGSAGQWANVQTLEIFGHSGKEVQHLPPLQWFCFGRTMNHCEADRCSNMMTLHPVSIIFHHEVLRSDLYYLILFWQKVKDLSNASNLKLKMLQVGSLGQMICQLLLGPISIEIWSAHLLPSISQVDKLQ